MHGSPALPSLELRLTAGESAVGKEAAEAAAAQEAGLALSRGIGLEVAIQMKEGERRKKRKKWQRGN